MATLLRFYTFSLVFTAICLGLVAWYGLSSTGTLGGMLSVLEVSLSFDNAEVNSAHIGIAGFGGAFLAMVSMKFLLNAGKDMHWISLIERSLARVSALPAIEIAILLLALWGIRCSMPSRNSAEAVRDRG